LAARVARAQLFVALTFLFQTCFAQTAAVGNDFEIRMERTGCLGNCPDYRVTIHSDGTVLYETKSDVHAKGLRKRKISSKSAHTLAENMLKADFFDIRAPGGTIIDSPVTTVLFRWNGRQGEIRNICNCVPDLVKVETEIDKTAGTDRWTRGWLRILFHWPWVRL